jgi:hypothetical protein
VCGLFVRPLWPLALILCMLSATNQWSTLPPSSHYLNFPKVELMIVYSR